MPASVFLDIFPSFLKIDILFVILQTYNLINALNILITSPRGHVLVFCSGGYLLSLF